MPYPLRSVAAAQLCAIAVLASFTIAGAPRAQDAARPSRAESVDLPELVTGRCFLIPPRASQPAPDAAGHALLVVLPGGTGNEELLPFVENGILGVAPDDCVGAMLVAPRWNAEQTIVWPSQRSRVPGMKFTTEAQIAATVAHAKSRWAIDPKRTFLLAWSSSGPVVYDVALAREVDFAGFYVAMSVFKSDRSLVKNAKDRRFVLDQSPDDRTTPIHFATDAATALAARGAQVWLRRYAGGHGWNDSPLPRIRSGLQWLASGQPAPQDTGELALAEGDALLHNGGFERDTAGWDTLDNSKTMTAKTTSDGAIEGKACLHVAKTGGVPMDVVRQDVDLVGRTRVQVSAQFRCKGAGNAWLKFFIHGPDGAVLLDDVDLMHVTGDRDWSRVARDYELPAGAKTGTVMIVMVLGGELWVDDVHVVAPRNAPSR